MSEHSKRGEIDTTVREAQALAAQSENGYVFVFRGADGWYVTTDPDVWMSQGKSALMVYPDGREDYVQADNWRKALALHREREETRRKAREPVPALRDL